jgi:tetratricopeptide (TPR) repeat protein
LKAGAKAVADHCFPARLEEIAILRYAMAARPRDARAPFYLGNLLYDRRRHREAIALWQRAVRLEPANAVAWRNLGIGACNILRRPAVALRAYEAALRAGPRDARVLFERDQLWKRRGISPARRLRALGKFPALLRTRDDLAVELCALYNQTGRPAEALRIVSTRRFQPWEGGEGQALAQHARTHLLLGRAALARGDVPAARRAFELALTAPENLGEARHRLANASELHFWLGESAAAAGDTAAARTHWSAAAACDGDFQGMRVRAFSEMTYWSALALGRLGRRADAKQRFRALLDQARALGRAPAKIDYFATSLPTMLLFEEDLAATQRTTALFMEAQARLGLGERAAARRLLATVLRRDPAHAAARDLLA